MTDPAAIVDVAGMCVVWFNSAFAGLAPSKDCGEGRELLKVFPSAGPILSELCQEAIGTDDPVNACFSLQESETTEVGFWTARLNRLRGDGCESLVALSMHEETDHIRLIRRFDSITSGSPGDHPGLDLRASLNVLMAKAVFALDAMGAGVMLVTDDRRALRPIAYVGPQPYPPVHLDLSSFPPVAHALSASGSLYIGRHAVPPSMQTFMEHTGFDSLLICPMQLSNGTGLVFALYPTVAGEPPKADVCSMEIIASKCVSLIDSHANELALMMLVREERTAHALAEQSVREIKAMLNSLADGVVIVDSSGEVKLANNAAARLFDIEPENLRTWSQLRDFGALHGNIEASELLSTFDSAKLLSLISSAGCDFELNGGSAKRIMRVTGGGVYNADGALESLIVVFHDWTAIHHMRRAQQDVLRFVSHDLRTPLTQIMARAQLIEITARDPEAVRRAAGSIVKASRRMNDMIQDITDSARLDMRSMPLHLRTIDILATLHDVVDVLASANPSTQIRISEPRAVPAIVTDPLRVDRIISNLVSNAIKYSPAGSPVTIELSTTEDAVVIAVGDRGPGMTEEEVSQAFERYYRAPEAAKAVEGLGLGLYICRSLVEALGGRIWVESAIGHGSTFTFTLPLHQQATAE